LLPEITGIVSQAPAALHISWATHKYLNGDSLCIFSHWQIDYAKVATIAGHIIVYHGTDLLFYDASSHLDCDIYKRDTRMCGIWNLEGVVRYKVRVTEICTVSDLNSLPAVTLAPFTQPWPGLPPEMVNCTLPNFDAGVTDWAIMPSWESSDVHRDYDTVWRSENCTFFAWDVELMLFPREASVSPDGVYEVYQPGFDWTLACRRYDRNDTYCKWGVAPPKDGSLPDGFWSMRSGRQYLVRVRERCTDILADSNFTESNTTCDTVSVPATPVRHISFFDSRLYSFRLKWDAGYTGACLFSAWEFQALSIGFHWETADYFRSTTTTTTTTTIDPYRINYTEPQRPDDPYNNTSWNFTSNCTNRTRPEVTYNTTFTTTAPHDWSLVEYGCSVTDRLTHGCKVAVGLGSGQRYLVRGRETCTNRLWYSDWAYMPGSIVTPLPLPAGAPENITKFVLGVTSVRVDWDAADPGECTFVAWGVELSNTLTQQYDWWEVPECLLVPRAVQSCVFSINLGPENATYNIRIREKCTDPHRNPHGFAIRHNFAKARLQWAQH
jgi:hypothetical protein